jgi:starch phosphorylase
MTESPLLSASSSTSASIRPGLTADEIKQAFRDNLVCDPFLLLADYGAYIDDQTRVSALWNDQRTWTRQSILNSARMGKFSSDRSIRDYCSRVWNIQPSRSAALPDECF